MNSTVKHLLAATDEESETLGRLRAKLAIRANDAMRSAPDVGLTNPPATSLRDVLSSHVLAPVLRGAVHVK